MEYDRKYPSYNAKCAKNKRLLYRADGHLMKARIFLQRCRALSDMCACGDIPSINQSVTPLMSVSRGRSVQWVGGAVWLVWVLFISCELQWRINA